MPYVPKNVQKASIRVSACGMYANNIIVYCLAEMMSFNRLSFSFGGFCNSPLRYQIALDGFLNVEESFFDRLAFLND